MSSISEFLLDLVGCIAVCSSVEYIGECKMYCVCVLMSVCVPLRLTWLSSIVCYILQLFVSKDCVRYAHSSLLRCM